MTKKTVSIAGLMCKMFQRREAKRNQIVVHVTSDKEYRYSSRYWRALRARRELLTRKYLKKMKVRYPEGPSIL